MFYTLCIPKDHTGDACSCLNYTNTEEFYQAKAASFQLWIAETMTLKLLVKVLPMSPVLSEWYTCLNLDEVATKMWEYLFPCKISSLDFLYQ